MAKEAKLTIEKSPINVDGKLEQRQKLAKALEEKLNNFTAELETKQYLIEGKAETAKGILEFIKTKAEWKFSEAMGIIESVKQLTDIVKDIETGKRKEFMAPNLLLEAIYYFLSKETGTGLESANQYFTLLKPVLDALSRAKMDKDKKNQMEKDLGTVQSAIDTGAVSEMEENMLLEIEAETAI